MKEKQVLRFRQLCRRAVLFIIKRESEGEEEPNSQQLVNKLQNAYDHLYVSCWLKVHIKKDNVLDVINDDMDNACVSLAWDNCEVTLQNNKWQLSIDDLNDFELNKFMDKAEAEIHSFENK